ncbi:uncharacterized protein [Nothobranchius furzeri]|uniref:uncharacterized protein isoform X1 n=1 Tax=Nothobranchius furzeri TaxID=105023 RepID=UPI002404470E|nr:uncharacterized protein LOC129153230 isoform X1 [Nothobranchius furzeri]XP_054588518.1 uncharacterized protein LOC129153230 isoform X1 [Nothobranchius furzeri]XP_054591522.1 uncharacterized protein LOC129155807 isoform X6 [Nothobranchius furzeri]XP_054591523.1 uncharacterized protein LOC129155807 isoform X7 [Nothobranchius furzeri]XP_054603599.1 uncharacterized protein LOC107395839 isoform X1 [Nothobranchius furzeri]XP_054603600.1 uncharacterized protein LOC107395839 isoform X1 [Nothobranch
MSTRKRRKKPIDDAKTHILSCTDKVGFMSRYIDGYKGRGVFATPPNEPGDFVLEYRGKLLTKEECESRRYSETESKFLFGFKWQNHCLCLDASEEDGSLGRLVNDNHKNPNCVMKKIIVDNKPHLCLFSLKKIEIGAEIYYNYGDSKWPWRSKVGKNKAPAAAKENLLGGEGQMKGLQTPAAAEENEASPVPQMLNDGPIPDETYTQMKGLQTPAAAEENEASPVPQMLNDGPIPDETYTQTIHMEGPLAEDIEDVCVLGDKGSDDEVSMSSRQECTSISESQNQRVSATDVSMPEEGSEHEVSMSSLQECTSTPQVQNQTVSAKKREKQTAVKRSWTPEECAAVDKHLRRFIVRSQVPGKEECQRCITAAPEALRNRDWKAGKYYVKNRITALRRKVV